VRIRKKPGTRSAKEKVKGKISPKPQASKIQGKSSPHPRKTRVKTKSPKNFFPQNEKPLSLYLSPKFGAVQKTHSGANFSLDREIVNSVGGVLRKGTARPRRQPRELTRMDKQHDFLQALSRRTKGQAGRKRKTDRDSAVIWADQCERWLLRHKGEIDWSRPAKEIEDELKTILQTDPPRRYSRIRERILQAVRDPQFRRKKSPWAKINFIADSVGCLDTPSLRYSRNLVQEERKRERLRIVSCEFYIRCSCGYKGPTESGSCPECKSGVTLDKLPEPLNSALVVLREMIDAEALDIWEELEQRVPRLPAMDPPPPKKPLVN
jgi:hypothetical protein